MTVEHVNWGEGAPEGAPPSIGAHYTDTTNGNQYLAVGTADAADWLLLARAGQLPAAVQLVPAGGSPGQVLTAGSGGSRSWATPEGGGGGGGLTKANAARKIVQGYLGPGAISFYDLEIGHVGWYPFASLDQLSTLYEAPAAILGDGVARASVYPAVAASGRQVEVSVAAEAGASSEATTPQIVSYGGEFGQNPYEPGLLPGDSVFSSIILRASTGYGAAVPADIGVNYNFTFMGHSFSFYREAGGSWNVGFSDGGDWTDLPVSESRLWDGVPQTIEATGVQHPDDPLLIDWTLNLIYAAGSAVVVPLTTFTTEQAGYNQVVPSIQLERPYINMVVERGDPVTTGVFTWRLQLFYIEAILA